MMPSLLYGMRRFGRDLADATATLPILRWTWHGDAVYAGELPDLRPADPDAVRDMMAGRYLFASKLVETGGASPFGLDIDSSDWWQSLHSFAWLRHFRDLHDPGERGFARMLVLDWISREGHFEQDSWAPGLCAQRVLNWLRHLPLLLDGASLSETHAIQRILATQVQSLRIRAGFCNDPTEALLAIIALSGAEYCDQSYRSNIAPYLSQLNTLLSAQIDSDGLHCSRNPRLQLNLLVELASIRRIATDVKTATGNELVAQIDRMHESLDALTLSNGEPVYFNGCGQLPHDILVAIQAKGPMRRQSSMLLGGYGILRDGDAVVIADSGLLPKPEKEFADDHFSSALAIEFSHGSDLILGSCGPAPVNLPDARALFRQSIAHSAPTIDAEDVPGNADLQLALETADHMLTLTSEGYARKFGVEIERQLTLIRGGMTLVGQDRIIAKGAPTGHLAVRFHLAPGIAVHDNGADGFVQLTLSNGATWSFLWEGASFREEESVRQSAYFGFQKTRQLVLETDLDTHPDAEISWVLTRERD